MFFPASELLLISFRSCACGWYASANAVIWRVISTSNLFRGWPRSAFLFGKRLPWLTFLNLLFQVSTIFTSTLKMGVLYVSEMSIDFTCQKLIVFRHCSKELNFWDIFLKASSSLWQKYRTSRFSGWRSSFVFGWFRVQILVLRAIIRDLSMVCSVSRDKFRYITLFEGCEIFQKIRKGLKILGNRREQ
jgi:hypothetical protein